MLQIAGGAGYLKNNYEKSMMSNIPLYDHCAIVLNKKNIELRENKKLKESNKNFLSRTKVKDIVIK